VLGLPITGTGGPITGGLFLGALAALAGVGAGLLALGYRRRRIERARGE
jgi:hypothetical protein